MALKQGLTAAAIAHGFEMFAGYSPTPLKAAIAGLSGVADYYSKTSVFPMLNLSISGLPAQAAGAAAGGASYAAILGYAVATGEDVTSLFMRGAVYAFTSDIALGYINPNFRVDKFLSAVSGQVFNNEKSLDQMEYKSSYL